LPKGSGCRSQAWFPTSCVERYHLGPVITESKVEFLRFVLPPGKSTGGTTKHAPGTIERVYILRGTVDVLVGGKTFSLTSGDAIVYRASVAHALLGTSTEPAEVYLVVERP
jgi:XRE family transcriptional regulator, regulator of sulfur utilization